MEQLISRKIIRRYLEKLEGALELDAAIVGAGPSGLVCAGELARAGRRVAIFERTLKPGGGIWGGAMLYNEIVLQKEITPFLEAAGIRYESGQDQLVTADSIEVASALIYRAVHAGARIFNGVTVEDVIFKHDRVSGVVINWSPVLDESWPVDPLMVAARCVLDAGGHDGLLSAKVARKAGVRLETESGEVMGEKPMWAEKGEEATVANTGRIYPGLYVSGMAANGVRGSFRMGPIFGGMILSGQKAARLILEEEV